MKINNIVAVILVSSFSLFGCLDQADELGVEEVDELGVEEADELVVVRTGEIVTRDDLDGIVPTESVPVGDNGDVLSGTAPTARLDCVPTNDCGAMDVFVSGSGCASPKPFNGIYWNGTNCAGAYGCNCTGGDCGNLLPNTYEGAYCCIDRYADTCYGN